MSETTDTPRDDGLARAHGAPALAARMRTTPEDFVVEEIDAFEASGSGEHLLLTIEKRGMNTAFAAKRIAQWAGVAESAIGYAGLKDRHAVTRQRVSVWIPKKIAPDIATLQSDELKVLAHAWHSRKLPRGALAGNRFVLTLREVEGDAAAIEARLQAIAARGVPNYFGEQRFGRGGRNIDKALAMFAGRRVPREERTHLLSGARSELFNRVLSARVAAGHWDAPLDGEVWSLDGSRSVFGPEPWSEALAARLAAFDIHPSGPLWGRGELRSEGLLKALEQATLSGEQALALRDGLERAGLEQERRALRLRPSELAWDWPAPAVLRLRFALPPGCYATTVLAELGDVVDASGATGPV
ncbi:tRNA pseudouridine(13) synthase TruD [Lysobacter brunescens]|uniref:tRNA pseudouridine synthase D n=1 Tax=Lysobacter brunescens TaxID=262323 RepID=A0ABW2YDT3_9GAMM